jgi:hypothetical protein
MGKEFPILGVTIDRELKDTGQPGRPFFAKICETMRIRFLGLLIFKTTNKGNFPGPELKK